MSKKLIFFTNSFPYGIGEMWKANELNAFVHYFDKITVVPLHYAGNFDDPKPLPQGVESVLPLFEEENINPKITDIAKIIIDKDFFYYWSEFFSKKAFQNKTKIKSWLAASLNFKRLKNHQVLQKILKDADTHTVLYFYWGKGTCDILPLLNKSQYHKIVVRMHRYDLYEHENNGYIPYRRQLLKAATTIAPISQNGLEHLKTLYPNAQTNLKVIRCGCISEGLSKPSTDNTMRIVTCSVFVPVKRVYLIVQTLQTINNIPIEWTHIGAGKLMSDIKTQCQTLPKNIKVNLIGEMDSRKILQYYIQNPFDLFLNVSSSEGVPISIMEAFSASIPVFATDVGGTAEIVNDHVGRILPANLTPELLAKKIVEYYHLPNQEKIEIRQNAYTKYQTMCDAKQLAHEFGKFLIS